MINLKTLAHIGLFLFVKSNEVTYFDSFGVEYTPEEIKKFIESNSRGNKNIKTNIFRIQDIFRQFMCILFIGFMIKGKTLNDFNNFCSSNDF